MKKIILSLACLFPLASFAYINTGSSLPSGVVTNNQPFVQTGTNFSSTTIVSNGTYGALNINRSGTPSSQASIDTYGGTVSITPSSSGQFSAKNYGGTTVKNWDDSTGYTPLYAGGSTYLVPFMREWQKLPIPFIYRSTDTPVTCYSDQYGGSGAALYDLPHDRQALVQAMPCPPLILTTWSGSQFAWTENLVSNQIANNCLTNGLFAACTNSGIVPIIFFDSNSRWETNSRISGKLAINTDYYPSGTNFVNYWSNIGYDFYLTLYLYPTIATQTNLNFVGTPAAIGPDTFPAMTPNTIYDDMETLRTWRMSVRASDVSTSPSYYRQFARTIAQASLTPTIGGQYARAFSSTFGAAYKPQGIIFMAEAQGVFPTELWPEMNCLGYDQPGSYYGYSATTDSFVSYADFFRATLKFEVPYSSKGHWPGGNTGFSADGTSAEVRQRLSYTCLGNTTMQLFCYTNQTVSQTYPVFISYATNSAFQKIWADSAYKVETVYALGRTNVNVYAKEMKNHDPVLAIINESGGATNVTVSLTDYPFYSNRVYVVSDVWAKTNSLATNTFTWPAPSKDAGLFRLSQQ